MTEPVPAGTAPAGTGLTKTGLTDPGPAGTGLAQSGGAGTGGAPERAGSRLRGDTLGLRLALAFLGVALTAIVLLAVSLAVFAATDISSLADRQRTELASAVAVPAGAAWEQQGRWSGADLSPVYGLAQRIGVAVQVRDTAGRVVAATSGFGAVAGPRASAPVIAGGQTRGVVTVRSTSSGIGAADSDLRTTLLRIIAGAAGLAALLALVTGLTVARRITRPIARLIAVTRSMAAGDRSSRAGDIRAPAELRDLAAAFDQMAEAVDREDRIRRDLVAGLAHELRTPVAVLQAGHEALLDGIVEPTAEELSSLRDEVLRLARMVDDLQTLTAADTAALHLIRQPCDLAGIAAAAADSLGHRFEAAGIELGRQLLPAPVLGDPRWLHQVVTNLLANALKFTAAGGRVTVRTSVADGAAVLAVTDTGRGIAAEELPRVFDRFWRGRGTGAISGSGIGLTIAAELARAHDGQLTAASTEGEGTTMTLRLPRAEAGPGPVS
jgi:two-component system sensor histidine kinase BaeS